MCLGLFVVTPGQAQGFGKCGSKRVVGLESPYPQICLGALTSQCALHLWVCLNCTSPIFTRGYACPACGARLPI